ncbi:MAG: DUF2258 domain-containing protein [Acidilobaceae archaeon]|nr:DUF2258 domain-containing protein [Acidilobaceae archaeon]
MPVLRSGVVLAGGYAEKLKRAFFAQVREHVKKGELKKEEAVKSIVELNKNLYHLLVEEWKVDKGDVVRISIEYEIKDGTISWKWETLTIEIWPKCLPIRVYASTGEKMVAKPQEEEEKAVEEGEEGA